jgi:hypothetical protein
MAQHPGRLWSSAAHIALQRGEKERNGYEYENDDF